MSFGAGRCFSVTCFQMRALYGISLLHCYSNCSLATAGSPPATHEWKEESVPIYWQWRHDSSACSLTCIANMWIQNSQPTWHSVINIKVSLLLLILTHYSLSLCKQNQRCDPGLVLSRSFLPMHSCSVLCTLLHFVQHSLKVQSHETVPSQG